MNSSIFNHRTIVLVLINLTWITNAQVNSGSNGSDGAFNPTTSTVINMADHPDGIYQYTSVNVPSGVTVSFIPNSNNTPVVWLIQGNCVISGTIDVSGRKGVNEFAGKGGPGGFQGGNGGSLSGSAGEGPGGGMLGGYAYSASFGALATQCANQPTTGLGAIYGNSYLLPLVGGSGGGGTTNGPVGGGGGGGAMLIAASQSITFGGTIKALGGDSAICGFSGPVASGAGSGGAVRLVSTFIHCHPVEKVASLRNMFQSAKIC